MYRHIKKKTYAWLLFYVNSKPKTRVLNMCKAAFAMRDKEEYLTWCQTDEDRKYLKRGNEYNEEGDG